MRFLRTDCLGRVCRFEPQLIKAEQTEELDGDFTLELTCLGVVEISQGDHLIYEDDNGTLRDTIVVSPEVSHDSSGVTTSIVCHDAFAEQSSKVYIDDKRVRGGTAQKTMQSLFSFSSSKFPFSGDAEDNGVTADISFYHTFLWDSVSSAASTFGMEIQRTYTKKTSVEWNNTTGESYPLAWCTCAVKLVKQLKSSESLTRRFDYGYDLQSATRTVSADLPVTRMYGFGKGLETDNGGYSRKLTFGDINKGLNYVDAAGQKGVYPQGVYSDVWYDQTFEWVYDLEPYVGIYENSDCEDAAQLLKETKAALVEASQSKVSYEVSVTVLARDSDATKGNFKVYIGDSLTVVDKELDLRVNARVSKRVVDLLDRNNTTVTLGNVVAAFSTQALSASASAQSAASSANSTAQSTAATQADAAATIARVTNSGDKWDNAATNVTNKGSSWDDGARLAQSISIVNGLPVFTIDGHTYTFSTKTGTFVDSEAESETESN